jgi:hypothetical protein
MCKCIQCFTEFSGNRNEVRDMCCEEPLCSPSIQTFHSTAAGGWIYASEARLELFYLVYASVELLCTNQIRI